MACGGSVSSILLQLFRSTPVTDGSAESHISFETKTFLLPRNTRWTFWPYGERALQPSCQWLLVFARAFLCHVLSVAHGIARHEHAHAGSPLGGMFARTVLGVERRVGIHPQQVGPFFSDGHGVCGALCLRAVRLCLSHCERASV